VSAGLLVEDEVDVFAFRHALVGETVSAGLLGRERRRIHEAALAALLEADEPDDAAIAHHAAAAGAVDVMLDAVKRAAAGALARGAAYHALEFAELGLSEAPDDPVLNRTATRAAWLVGALDDAAQHAARWIRAASACDDVVEEARARRAAMRVAWDVGDDVAHAEQHRRLVGLVERMPVGEERAATLADLAQANMLADRFTPTIEFAERAIAEARAIGAERVEAQALVERYSCLAGDRDTPAENTATVLAAVARAEALGDHVTAARGLNNVAERVSVEQRREIIERMRANAESAGFVSLAAYSYAKHLGELASLSADRAELDRWLTHAWRWRRMAQCRTGTKWLEFYSALAEAENGESLGLTIGDSDRRFDHEHALLTGLDLLRAAARRDVGAAHDALDDWVASYQPVNERMFALAVVVDAALRTGIPAATVHAIVDGAIPTEHRHGSTWHLAAALLTAAAGDRRTAEEHLGQVGDEVAAWLRGEVELRLAELALDAGEADAAARWAATASARFARWPGWRRDRADALLRRLERRSVATPGNALSGRELEVAALLAEGLSNAQIAERLFIARKTAAVHVSNILAKLGMRSRTEIAAWAVRNGLAAGEPSGYERAG
jgi:DNA-binding CsgD family transcriptional regulator